MNALDIISLEDAKSHLVVDFPDQDSQITRLIKTAVAWVENYTGYAMYQRDIEIPMIGFRTAITTYPIIINSITNSVQYTSRKGALTLFVECYEWCGNLINATIGYAEDDIDEIPSPLIDAAYKIITYLYENKDAYQADLPADIQTMINQYRRSATI